MNIKAQFVILKMSLHVLKGTGSLKGTTFQYSWNNNICLFLFSSSVVMCYKKEKFVWVVQTVQDEKVKGDRFQERGHL